VVSRSIYLFTVSNFSLLRVPVSFWPFGAKQYDTINNTIVKVSEEVNRKCPARNMTVQFSAPYTD